MGYRKISITVTDPEIIQINALYRFTLPAPNMEYMESTNGNTHIWHFDLPKMALPQPQTSIVALIPLSPAVLRTEFATCNVRN